MPQDDDQATEFEQFHSWRAGWRDGVHGRAHQGRFAQHPARADLRLAYLTGYDEGNALRLDAERKAQARIGYRPTVLRKRSLDAEVERDLAVFEGEDTGRFHIPGSGLYPKTEPPQEG
jgi:hypothetical protein